MTAALKLAQTPETELPDWLYDCCEDSTKYREFCITKGLGAGGTYGMAIWHLTRCEQNSDSKFSWSVAPTYQQVVDTLIPTFSQVLQDTFNYAEGEDYEIVLSSFPRIRLLGTKQVIFFKSANRPDRLVGPTISHLSGTEPGLWQETAFQKSLARLRCPSATVLQSFFEGTPEGLGNPWEQRANFDEGLDKKRNRVRMIVETGDNLHLPSEYVGQLIKAYEYDPGKLESYIHGRFVNFQRGTAYWDFRESRNKKLDLQAHRELPIIFAWDFGVSPLAWVAIQDQPHITKSLFHYRRFAVIGESGGKAKGLDDACAEFIATFDPAIYGNTPIEVDGGHDGYVGSYHTASCAYDQIVTVLRRFYKNVRVTASNSAPEIKDRLNLINRMFAYERIVVAAGCRNTINSFVKSSLKDGTWKLEKKKGGEDPTHFGDAVCAALFHRAQTWDLDGPYKDKIFGANISL